MSGLPAGRSSSPEAQATGRARESRGRECPTRAEIAANARAAIEQATRAHADAEAALRQAETQLAANAELTATFPDAGFVTGELARIDEVGRAHAAARAREREARAAETAAEEQRRALEQQLQTRRSEYESQRDLFVRAGLEPPPAEPDLAASWTALKEWANTARAAERGEGARAAKAADTARAAARRGVRRAP